VFVSSAAPLRGIAHYAPYVAARAAANGLVSSLAKELGRDGITVNAVGSNYVENPDYFPPQLLANPEAMAKMTAQIPLGRLGKSRELGAAICFLCSDGAASSPATSCRTPAAGRRRRRRHRRAAARHARIAEFARASRVTSPMARATFHR
jgi:NAD(P)-dependent dehydrogenase (short-subunit alcohol dehydrogenase family)